MPRISRLDDLHDPRAEPYRDVRDKDLRGRDRVFMAESAMVVRRLLAERPEQVRSLLLAPGPLETLRPLLDALPDTVDVLVADVDQMTAIAGFHIHRGVLALGMRPRREALTLDAALGPLRGRGRLRLLLAEAVTNVDNMGALFRNAAAFGVDGIVLDADCCDPLYRKAIRVSMGHVLSTPWAVSRDWTGDLERLRREWDVTIVAAECTDDSMPAWSLPRLDRAGILLGSEAYGVRPETLAACDHVAEVPMPSGVPSLNVAVASALMLYELARPPQGAGRATPDASA